MNVKYIVLVFLCVAIIGAALFFAMSVSAPGTVDDTPSTTPTGFSSSTERFMHTLTTFFGSTEEDEKIPPEEIKLPSYTPVNPEDVHIAAWIYPGEPSCAAVQEYTDGRNVAVLKPEYFRVEYDGALSFLTEEIAGCNGFSEQNVANVKASSEEQYVTVASIDANGMNVFLERDVATNEYTNRLVQFVIEQGFTGVELDFEDFGNWGARTYAEYKNFVIRLGTALHQNGKNLIVDGPPVANETQASWYQWRYEDFNALPVDFITVMAYDYQYDQGTGSPVTPLSWLEGIITWTTDRITDPSRIVIGLPSYGYQGLKNTHQVEIMTYEQLAALPGFDFATRDPASGEMMWQDQTHHYVYQDSISLDLKRDVVAKHGIEKISVWHLGGNQWFSSGE